MSDSDHCLNNPSLERRGLFYDDLGVLARYPADLVPLKVLKPDVDTLMAGDDYALQMQLQIEHQEKCIIAFDKMGERLYLETALGHRGVHQWLAGRLLVRLAQELNAGVRPAVETVRFMKIPTRPPLHQILSNLEREY